ncbi:MAG TPA: adenylate/guanylate cyclase domain-containing protein [bacterium]|nr:adenylate/guanylate cyclase domain-containing protein [bacterium]
MIRCARCGRENPSDAQFCMRCGAPLSQICPNCGTANALDAQFCLNCGRPLASGATTERRLLSVLFADLVGSTRLTQRLDPEALRAMIGEYFSVMREEIVHHGGSVEKFIGDAVMAVFGLPVAHEDDSERALRAAVAMQQRLPELNTRLAADLHMRIGISTGEVIADPAAVRDGQFMVTGEIVNLASRLQTQAPADGIVVDERTYDATRHLGEYTPAAVPDGIEFAGRRFWRFAEMVAGRTPPRRLRARLVGREDEMQFLQALYRRVVEGRQHHLVTVIGPAGVGKSRLVREFVGTLPVDPVPPAVLRGRCPAYGEGLTYWPVAEMLKQECEIKDDDPPGLVAEKLHQTMLRIGESVLGREESESVAAALAPLLGAQPARPADVFWRERLLALKTVAESLPVAVRETAVADESRRGGDVVEQAVRNFLFAKAQAGPLVLIFEDLHWAEPSLLELLEHPSLRGLAAPILTLCLARPELLEQHPDWGARVRNYTALSLAPLPEARGRTLIAELLAGDSIAKDVGTAILAKAEGNPLFIEEILQMLIDSGDLVHGTRGWERGRAALDIRIPDTIHGILVSRLDLLTPLEKRVIQDAAIPGRVFWGTAAAVVGQLSPAEVTAALTRLQERDLIEERPVSSLSGDREYAFKHALIREVAYSMVPKLGRSARHLRFAEWLEQAALSGEKFLEVRAHHCEQAWRYRFEAGENDQDLARRAIAAIRAAGDRAASLRTLPEARRLYERALAVLRNAGLEDDVALRLELLTDHVEVVKWMSVPAVVIDETDQILSLAPAIGREDLVARAWLNVGFAEFDRNRLEPAEAALSKAEELFRRLGDPTGEAEALELLGLITDWLRGSLTKAHKAYRQALELYREHDNQQGVARTMAWLGRSVFNSGNLAEARTLLTEARTLARAHHERISERSSLTGLGQIAHVTGDSPAAIERFREAIALAQATGDHVSEVGIRRHLGMHYLRYGRLDEAEDEFNKAEKLRRQHGAKTYSAVLLRGRAEVALARGEVLTAAEQAEQALALVPEEDEIAVATHSVTLGKIRAAQGRADEADALFRRGLALLEGQEYRIDLALTLLKYGEGMILLGREARAREVLAQARELFQTIGATYFVDEVERRLPTNTPSEES